MARMYGVAVEEVQIGFTVDEMDELLSILHDVKHQEEFNDLQTSRRFCLISSMINKVDKAYEDS